MDGAQTALQQNDSAKARSNLDQAAGKLLIIYEQVPTGRLLQTLSTTRQQVEKELALTHEKKVAVDVEPLATEIKRMDEYLDPKVLQSVKDGMKAQRDGDSLRFVRDLKQAEVMVARDTSVWPLEDAYSRVVAAREAFDQGRTPLASQLLLGVHDAVALATLQAPLVPIRFDLRAAAVAAESDNPIRANKLTRQAADDLRNLSREASPAVPELQSLTQRADQLSNQLDRGKNVNSGDLRSLADATFKLIPQARG